MSLVGRAGLCSYEKFNRDEKGEGRLFLDGATYACQDVFFPVNKSPVTHLNEFTRCIYLAQRLHNIHMTR